MRLVPSKMKEADIVRLRQEEVVTNVMHDDVECLAAIPIRPTPVQIAKKVQSVSDVEFLDTYQEIEVLNQEETML